MGRTRTSKPVQNDLVCRVYTREEANRKTCACCCLLAYSSILTKKQQHSFQTSFLQGYVQVSVPRMVEFQKAGPPILLISGSTWWSILTLIIENKLHSKLKIIYRYSINQSTSV